MSEELVPYSDEWCQRYLVGKVTPGQTGDRWFKDNNYIGGKRALELAFGKSNKVNHEESGPPHARGT